MNEKEFFDGFNVTLASKAKGKESYFAAEEVVRKSIRKPTQNKQDVEKLGRQYYENIAKTAHRLFEELASCIDKGLKPASSEVQRIIKKHHTFADKIYHATKEVYRSLAQLYREHPEFIKHLSIFHPELAEYMASAMEIFADAELT